MNGPTRRLVSAGLPALAIASPAFAAKPNELTVKGLTTYSESVMVMSVSADGRSALTLRFCRFPDVGLTWLWCHIVRDSQMFAFTHHELPCGKMRLADGPDADYRAPPVDAMLMRIGKGAGLKRAQISAALPFHSGVAAPNGPGDVRGRLAGAFTPTHALVSQVLKDRDEVYGQFEGEVAIGGRRWTHKGVAKFHEQRQTGPRFETPFCYSWLGADNLAATTLLVDKAAAGGWIFGDVEDGLADMATDPPDERRTVSYRLKSGRNMPGQLSAIVRYEVPIYGRRWQGSFVRGIVDGRPVVGVMNDWPGPPDIYAPSLQRLG